MSLPHRAVTVWPSVASVQTSGGPFGQTFIRILGAPGYYAFTPGDATPDDGLTCLQPLGIGGPGTYLLVREPDDGPLLTDASATITVAGGRWRSLLPGTLTANRSVVLGAANARRGDPLELTLDDPAAFTLAVVDGGPGGATLATKPASARAFVKAYFNGTNWVKRDAHLMI